MFQKIKKSAVLTIWIIKSITPNPLDFWVPGFLNENIQDKNYYSKIVELKSGSLGVVTERNIVM